ncbi:MAG: Fic family protein [Mycoplasmatota bacterium]
MITVLIGWLHIKFEAIHPFIDGNGRSNRQLIKFYHCIFAMKMIQ